MPDHAVEFTTQRKGVGSWVGPEAGIETGNVVSSTCVHRKRASSHSAQRRPAGHMWLGPAVSTISECTVAAAMGQPLKLFLSFFLSFVFLFFFLSSHGSGAF